MPQKIQKVESFGEGRQLILETVLALRDGTMPVATGTAIAQNLKVLNDNMQVEINAAKLAIQTNNTAHRFGRVKRMGTTLIGDVQNHENA